jgi:hypothetical protein
MKNLTAQNQSESDLVKQNHLIARQNDFLSYVSGLGIAVGTETRIPFVENLHIFVHQ